MHKPAWSHFPHSADVGVRGIGRTLAEAFEQAGVALFAAATDLSSVGRSVVVDIQCNAPDYRLLLVDWLNALIYEASVRKAVFAHFEVHIAGHRLVGRAWGETIDQRRHLPAVEPKGATLTELKVEQAEDGTWLAQCVVDV